MPSNWQRRIQSENTSIVLRAIASVKPNFFVNVANDIGPAYNIPTDLDSTNFVIAALDKDKNHHINSIMTKNKEISSASPKLQIKRLAESQ